MKNLSLHIITWNVASSKPLSHSKLIDLTGISKDDASDLYAVGLQEISTGAVETAKSFVEYDNWAKSMMTMFAANGYYLIDSVRLQGMSLSLFARLKHLPFIRFVKTSYERTGFRGNWGNKGGVVISVWLHGESVAFLNTHLPAHLTNDDERVDDFMEILDGINFDDTATILSHDATFWFGDTNFRIDDISREDVIESVKRKAYPRLLEKDQLKKHQKQNAMLSDFVESEITFAPTYKFDPGTNVYDTSEKQRKPAWTDRVLHRVHPDVRRLSEDRAILLSGNTPQTMNYVKQVEGSYQSHPEIQSSDHKPVSAKYTVQIRGKPDVLVELSIERLWRNDGEGEVIVTYHPGMLKGPKDYLALYEGNITDFRSYHLWVHVSPSADDEKIRETRTQRCVFPEVKIDECDTLYRVGYYCHRMACLLAISEPFEIKRF